MVIEVSLKEILSGVIFLALLLGVIQWLISIWIKSRLEQSIKHEYDKQLEEYRFFVTKRERAANIATALARWIKYRGTEKKELPRKDLIDYYEDLTRMSFEMSLWIDDEKTLKRIMSLFTNEPGAPNVREVLIEIRDLISKSKTESFKAEDIVVWPRKEIADELFNQNGDSN